jgi:hypothetical protein
VGVGALAAGSAETLFESVVVESGVWPEEPGDARPAALGMEGKYSRAGESVKRFIQKIFLFH